MLTCSKFIISLNYLINIIDFLLIGITYLNFKSVLRLKDLRIATLHHSAIQKVGWKKYFLPLYPNKPMLLLFYF